MDPKMECVASECDPNRYSNSALVIAWPRWFKDYKGELVYVSQFPPTSFVGFKAVLKDEISSRYWIDPNRREHRWFRCNRLIPVQREVQGVILSARPEGNVAVRIEIRCADGTSEQFFCRAPIEATSEHYTKWVSNRRVNHLMTRENKSTGEKIRVPNPDPSLFVDEFQYGSGPLGRLARACDGYLRLNQLKGMVVRLSWTESGVCDLFPLADSAGGGTLNEAHNRIH